jgi:hypothetical protein
MPGCVVVGAGPAAPGDDLTEEVERIAPVIRYGAYVAAVRRVPGGRLAQRVRTGRPPRPGPPSRRRPALDFFHGPYAEAIVAGLVPVAATAAAREGTLR